VFVSASGATSPDKLALERTGFYSVDEFVSPRVTVFCLFFHFGLDPA
jgi:hypothetical protein